MSNPHQRNDSIKNPKGPNANQKPPQQQQQRSNAPKGGSRGRGRGDGSDAPPPVTTPANTQPATVSNKPIPPNININIRTENRAPTAIRGIVPGLPPKEDTAKPPTSNSTTSINSNITPTTTTTTTSTSNTSTTGKEVENNNPSVESITGALSHMIPMRVHSAPPNLEEQRGITPSLMNPSALFIPDKSGVAKPAFSSGTTLNSQARPFVPGSYSSPTKKGIPIIDPETGEEIKPVNPSPQRHTSSTINYPRAPMYAPPPQYYQMPMMMAPPGQYPKHVPVPPFVPGAPPHMMPQMAPKLFPEFVPSHIPQPTLPTHNVQIPTNTSTSTTTPITTTTPSPQPSKTSSLLHNDVSIVEIKNITKGGNNTVPVTVTPSTSASSNKENAQESTSTSGSGSNDIGFSVPSSDASPSNNTTKSNVTNNNKEEDSNGSRPTKLNPFSIETSSIDTSNNSNSGNSGDSTEDKVTSNKDSKSITDIAKRIYDRDFLLQFKDTHNDKPESLPSLNELLISDASQSGSTPRSSRNNIRNTPGTSRAAPPGFGGNRNNNRGGSMNSPSGGRRMGGQKKMTKSFSGEQLSGNVLEPTAGRWEPSKFKRDASEDQVILSKVKGYLNKITEAKFEVLSNKIIVIALETVELLTGVIKLVFDKAVTEPKFCTMYAELCRKLSEKSPVFEREGKPVNFKRLLLNRCQEEFEGSFSKTVKKTVSNEEELTPDDKLKMEEEEFLQKKRMLGNITFIGELYKLNMLTEKIMHECITRLLGDIKNPSHEDMEALCKLMTTIGQKLDHSKAKDYMDKYFARMKELSRNKQLPSRIRFMLQDVIALRQNKWLSRKDPNSAATSTSTSSSNEPAQRPKEILSRTTHGSRPTPIQNTDKGRNSSASGGLSSSPDWETVPSKPGKGGRNTMSSSNRSINEEDDEPKSMRGNQSSSSMGGPVTLGPQGGFTGFKGGAKGWNQQSTNNNNTSSSSSSSTSDRKNSNSSGYNKSGYSDSNRKSDSSYKKLENVSTLSNDELHTKSEEILEELFSSGEIKEGVTCVKELNSSSFMSEFVNKGICIALEKKESDRELLIKLFNALLEDNIISTVQFEKGFESVIEILEDLVIDIPKVYTYYASLVGLAIIDDCLPMSFIDKLLDSHLSANNYSKAARILGDVLRSMAHASSYSKLRDLISENKFDITKVLNVDKRNNDSLVNYLETEKLTGLMPSLTYGKAIESMIKDKSPSGAILDYINDHVPEGERSDTSFCRDIISHIFKLVVTNPSKQEEIINHYTELLNRLLTDIPLQYQSLLEISDLYDSKALSKDNALSLLKLLRSSIVKNKTFLKWKDEQGNKDLVKSASDLISTTTEDQEEEDDQEELDEEEEDYEEQDYNSDE